MQQKSFGMRACVAFLKIITHTFPFLPDESAPSLKFMPPLIPTISIHPKWKKKINWKNKILEFESSMYKIWWEIWYVSYNHRACRFWSFCHHWPQLWKKKALQGRETLSLLISQHWKQLALRSLMPLQRTPFNDTSQL